jgi:propionyl-CoA carboxylase alpha chain
LAVVEAMKMQNVLRAEKKATVKSIAASPGDILQVDDTIIEFE